MTESKDLLTSLFAEMERVREIIKVYEDPILNGAGKLAAHLMREEIKLAEEAIKYSEVVDMIRLYKSLQGYQL